MFSVWKPLPQTDFHTAQHSSITHEVFIFARIKYQLRKNMHILYPAFNISWTYKLTGRRSRGRQQKWWARSHQLFSSCCYSERTDISPGRSGTRIARAYISRDCRSTVCRNNVSKKHRKQALLRQYPEENQSDYSPAFVELLRRGEEGARNVNS